MKEKVAQLLLTIQGFRKMIVTLLIIIVSIIFRAKNLVSGGEWTDLVKAIGLGFLGTNSAEGLFSVVKQHLAARRAAGNVLTPIPETGDDEDVELVPTAGDSK